MKSFFNKPVSFWHRQQTRTPETRQTSFKMAKEMYRQRIGFFQTAAEVRDLLLSGYSQQASV